MADGGMTRVLVTGGAGFIGSNFSRLLLSAGLAKVTVFDKLTYAGNRDNLRDLEAAPGFRFVQGDICDPAAVEATMADCDAVVNFAAETHVDRSLLDAGDFLRANVHGVVVLLEAARQRGIRRFVQVSTDEVYGDVRSGYSQESDPLRPRSPYSASKAAAEMMVMAYVESYGVPAVITRGSNTYGPYQYPEKFIPLMITNALEGAALPIYGDGLQVRDWIHVEDHCRGVLAALQAGEPGAAYNIGGGNERRNIDVAREILDILEAPRELIRHVADRPGHDRRYAVATGRLERLGWRPQVGFRDGLRQTIAWYEENRAWWKPLKSGQFEEYYRRNYGARAALADDRDR